MFPLVMKIVLESVEFNPFLAKIENCHRFDDTGAMLRQPQTRISISTAGRRGILRHATAGIALAGGGARRKSKADKSEKEHRKDRSDEHGCHSLLVRVGSKARTWNEQAKQVFYSIAFLNEIHGAKSPIDFKCSCFVLDLAIASSYHLAVEKQEEARRHSFELSHEEQWATLAQSRRRIAQPNTAAPG
ncbi:hypothetical protein [Rhizobium sp. BR 315]|uniref:hypothetical protein n=1 Tax=Rhizobium sp. BR 315 TaxID=3040014 RepID=UPI003D354B92